MTRQTDARKRARSALPRALARALAIAGKVFAGALLFVAFVLAGALLFANTATGRRLAIRQVNRALADSFRGTLTIESVGALRLNGVDDAKVFVRDGDGHMVLIAEGLSARVAIVPLARAFVAGKGALPITVRKAGLRAVEAILIRGADEQPTLARAFDPRHPTPIDSPPSRGIRLVFRDARIDRVRAHGEAASFDSLDVVISHLAAAFAYDAAATTADVQPFDLDAQGLLPQARSLAGRVEVHLRLPTSGDRSASASFDGGAGDIRLALQATVQGDDVKATARALGGGGTVDVHATGSIGDTKNGEVTAVIDGVDPHAIVTSAPETTIRAKAHLQARLDAKGALSGVADLQTQSMPLESEEVPPVTATARFTNDQAVGRLHAEEPGARADVDVDFHRRGAEETVDLEATARVPDLSRPALLRGQGLRGGASLHASGHADLSRKTVDGEVDAELAGLERADASAHSAIVRAQAHGALDAPVLNATVHAQDLRIGRRTIDRVEVDASGSLQRPAVVVLVHSQGLIVRGGGTLSLHDGWRADGVVVDLSRGATRATASLDRAQGTGDRIEIEGLSVTGLGSPIAGQAAFSRQSIALRLAAPDIDSRRLSALLGEGSVPLEGHASIDADVRGDRQGATGHVNCEFHSPAVRDIRQSDVRAALAIDGRQVNGALNVALDDVRADAKLSDVRVGGVPTELSSWKRATGAIDLDSNVNLATLRRLIHDDAFPFEQMRGELTLKAHLARARPDDEPDATVDASTEGLVLVSRPRASAEPTFVDHPERAEAPVIPWETREVDVRVSASLEGASRRVAFDGWLRDKGGAVVEAKLEALAPPGDLGRAAATLERTPLTLHVDVPEREVSELPPPVRPAALRGHVSGTLDVKGSPVDPRVELHVAMAGLQPMESKSAMPLDGTVDVTYDGRRANAKAHVARAHHDDDVVVDASADVDARVADLLGPSASEAPWEAKVNATLHGFPLEAIPQLATRHVGGLASGTVVLDGLHRDATLDANLQFSRMKLGREVFDDGMVRAHLDHDGLSASTRFEKPGSLLAATLKGKTQWGAHLSPSLDTTSAVDATLEAHAFRAAALMPFLQGAIHQLDGKVEARASVHVQPDFKEGTMDGDVVLSEGKFDAPAVGGSFHDVGARMTIRPWGTLRIDDIKVSGIEGKLSATASAQLDGMKLRTAKLVADIRHGDKMPLTIQGVSLGEASGHVQVDATMTPDQSTLNATVSVPKFQMDLPQSTGHSVQSLDPADHVVVGMHENDGRFVVLPLHAPEKPRGGDSMKMHVVVHLGDDVWIKRDTTLAIRLTGSPVLDIADGTRLTGSVHVTSGRAEVLGKRFTIQPDSTVSFTGDPNEPQLTVTALYEAPDKTKIYADIIGTLRSLKVHLRSDPPQPEDAILSLLLFGSPEGIGGTPPTDQQPDPTQRAAGLAGGIVTQGINRALSGITSLDISTRLDTSNAANPKPEVEVRVSSNIVTRVTVQTGMPAPGEAPDRTFLSIAWTFKPRWILESTVGDEGSTLFDVLWRHRY